MLRVNGRVGCLIAVLALGMIGSTARADAPEVARWLSADTVFYLEALKPAALFDRVSDPRLYTPFLALPSIRSLLENPEAGKLSEAASQVAEKLGMTPEKALASLTGGGIVLAVEAGSLGDPGICLIVTPSNPDVLTKAHDALLNIARRNADANGQADPVKPVDYRGVHGYQVGPQVVYGIVKGRLLIADRGDTAKLLVDRMLDGHKDQKPLTSLKEWSAREETVQPDTVAWAFARFERLRELDPDRFSVKKDRNPREAILFGDWVDALRKAPFLTAALDSTADRLALNVQWPTPKGRRDAALKGFVPPKGAARAALLNVPGTVASLSLWRDLTAVWDARAELLPADDVQKLAGLDTVSKKFFGGRDFRNGILTSLTSDWRAVAALQDPSNLDPKPDLKLPAGALIVGLKADDNGFADRLKIAFQSVVALANVNALQTQGTPLELGSEKLGDVTISTSHFLPPKKGNASADLRYNFTPSVVKVENHLVISSSVGLARALVKALQSKSSTPGGRETLVTTADGAAVAQLLTLNKDRIVQQNMRDQGHDKEQAEGEFDLVAELLRYLGRGRLVVKDVPGATSLGIEFATAK